MVTDVTDIAVTAVEAPITAVPRKRQDFGSSARLLGGFIGRAWLWFLAGCLVVTLLPLLFGWRPYVVESGSMQPRIKIGDVILSSPEHDEQKLLGHVTVFEDPDAAHPGTVKSHRVIKINPNGTMVTKGDANVTPDPAPLPLKNVKGIGRLLVRWIGLPVIWVQQAQWLKLGLLVATLGLAAFMVARDHEEPELEDESDELDEPGEPNGPGEPDRESDELDEPDDESDELDEPDDESDELDESDGDRPSGPLQWKPRASGLRRLRRARHRQPLRPAEFARVFAVRAGVVVVAAAGLFVPTAQAAFSATTSAVASVWSTAASFIPNYTQDTQALNPYLYWKLDDDKGTNSNKNTTAIDYSGNSRNGLYSPTPYSNTNAWDMMEAGALTAQTPNYSVYSDGGQGTNVSCVTTNSAAESPAPVTYSEIIWFKTPAPVTSKNGKTTTYYSGGGKLIGFESTKTGVSNNGQGGQYDRMIFMDSAGHLTFGVWTGSTTTVTPTATYNDGNWHMAVATMGGGTGGDGMKLYVDGALVGSNVNTTSQDYAGTNGGWWRVGCGNLQGWGSDFGNQTNYAFNGNLDEATVYTTELTAANVSTLYSDATATAPPPPPPPVSIVNGDFETGALAPWTCTGGAIVANPTHGGSSAVSLTQNLFQSGQCDQTVTALPNHAYTLTAYVYGTDVTVGVSGGATASKTASPGNAWQKVTLTFTTGASGTIDVSVQNDNTSWWGTTEYADDFILS